MKETPKSITFAANRFSNKDNIPFDPADYSKLKFGSDAVAKRFGKELADRFFAAHCDYLLTNDCVVIPSPYNHLPNAATVMAKHFYNRLNHLLVHSNGNHLEWSIIHRKVSYISDYGFLSADKRKALIDKDMFFLNEGFLQGKLLICVDDVKITGTHENKLKEILKTNKLTNPTAFIYYAEYEYDGTGEDIEGYLNFAGIKTIDDYTTLSKEPNHHLIVRPMKFILGQKRDDFMKIIDSMSNTQLVEIYNACIAEGFYKIPQYQPNFKTLSNNIIL